MSALAVISKKPASQAIRRSRSLVVVGPSSSSPPRRPRRRRSVHVGLPRGISSPYARSYSRLLGDPFEQSPMRLGFGTLVPTVLATGYSRGSFVVNTDGSFGIAMLPYCSDTLLINNSGANTTTWSGVSCGNRSSILGQMTYSRVLAGGLRLFCLFPQTAASGVLFAGSLSSFGYANYIGTPPQSLREFASSELGIGSNGASVVMLPVDPDCQIFSSYHTSGSPPPTTIFPATSTSYIVGAGFPVGTVVWYEAVLHLEGLPNQTANAVGIDSSNIATNTPASEFSTFENFVTAAKSLLTSPVVLDAALMGASLLPGAIGRSARGVASLVGLSRHRPTLVSGENARRQGHQNTVIIEEMKDHARR